MDTSVRVFEVVQGERSRDREERLFDFLADQMRSFEPEAWREEVSAGAELADVAYLALLLSNLCYRLSPEASTQGDRLASSLLGSAMTVAGYEKWLRRGFVDVNRLAGHLDHEAEMAGHPA